MSIAERYHQAMTKWAHAKSEADRLERYSKRVFSQLVIQGEGAVSHREHWARQHAAFISAEDSLVKAQTEANLAYAEAEGLKTLFEEWRTQAATNRAEMNLR